MSMMLCKYDMMYCSERAHGTIRLSPVKQQCGTTLSLSPPNFVVVIMVQYTPPAHPPIRLNHPPTRPLTHPPTHPPTQSNQCHGCYYWRERSRRYRKVRSFYWSEISRSSCRLNENAGYTTRRTGDGLKAYQFLTFDCSICGTRLNAGFRAQISERKILRHHTVQTTDTRSYLSVERNERQ